MIPSVNIPIVDINTGRVTVTWQRYFASQDGSPAAIFTVAVTASPFTYTASNNGSALLTGGTVTGLSLARGRVTLSISATDSIVPLSAGDALNVTYSAAPTINFIPR